MAWLSAIVLVLSGVSPVTQMPRAAAQSHAADEAGATATDQDTTETATDTGTPPALTPTTPISATAADTTRPRRAALLRMSQRLAQAVRARSPA